MSLNIRQITFLSMMLVYGLIVSYLERILPPLIPGLPGVKLGLANIVVVMLLYWRGYKSALLLNIMRVVLAGLLFTGLAGMMYALAGALLSFAGMCAVKGSRSLGVIGVSIVGGVCHNFGQISVAALLMDSPKLFYYLPVLIVSGVAAGAFIGYIAGLLINRLSNIFDGR